MSEIKNVNLQFNCPNKKDSFSQIDGDYHCSTCSKKVIDFTNKSEKELKAAVKCSDNGVCGIFKPSQISKAFLKYAATTAMIGSAFISNAQDQQHQSEPDSIDISMEEEEIFIGEAVTTGSILFNPITYPQPIGGYEKFYKALKSNLKYPDNLKVSGKTFLKLIIDTKGTIESVEVVKGFNKVADQEAVKAVGELKFPFEPGRSEGKAIESELIILVSFKLEENED